MARIRRTVSVLLLEDNEALGHVGDVIAVKPGFARNFLFPTGRACPVTPDAMNQVERAKVRATEARAQRAAERAGLMERLAGLSLTLEERASEEGHLFGSVGAPAIVAALAGQGVAIDEKQVQLEAPLKELGIFNVTIRLDPENATDIRVWVVETGA